MPHRMSSSEPSAWPRHPQGWWGEACTGTTMRAGSEVWRRAKRLWSPWLWCPMWDVRGFDFSEPQCLWWVSSWSNLKAVPPPQLISHFWDNPGILGFSFIIIWPPLIQVTQCNTSRCVLASCTSAADAPPVISAVGYQASTVGSLCGKSTRHHTHFLLAGNFAFRDASQLRNPSHAINSQQAHFILHQCVPPDRAFITLSTTKMSRCFKCHSFFWLLVVDFYCCFSPVRNILSIIILFPIVLSLAPSVRSFLSCGHQNYQSIRGPSNIFPFSRLITTTQVHFYWRFFALCLQAAKWFWLSLEKSIGFVAPWRR